MKYCGGWKTRQQDWLKIHQFLDIKKSGRYFIVLAMQSAIHCPSVLIKYLLVCWRKKKVGAERCEYVFDVHTSKASKELARKRKDDSRIYINIRLEDFT